MQIRRAKETDMDGLNKLLMQVLMVHHNGRPDLFKPNAKKYTDEELTEIIKRTSRVLNMDINSDAAYELAKRSRKTPRIANRLFKRVRDFASVIGDGIIDVDITNSALKRLKVDKYGLDSIDLEYLTSLINKFGGGPVGVETIAASIGEEVSTIEDVVEPYLLQEGFIKRTPRGRMVTEKAISHIKNSKTIDIEC